MIKNTWEKEIEFRDDIKFGDSSEGVKRVQEWINLNRYYHREWNVRVTVDSIFGNETLQAVKRWQKQFELRAYNIYPGKVDEETWRSLVKPMKEAFTSPVFTKTIRSNILEIADHHLCSAPRELSQNEGAWVRAYMDGNEGKPWAWCVGFVQAIIDQALSNEGRKFTEMMPHTYSCDALGDYGIEKDCLIRNKDIKDKTTKEMKEIVDEGDLFLLKRNLHDWIHVGIINWVDDDLLYTIEGNTNDDGSREGVEVCNRTRNWKEQDIDIFKLNL